MASVASWRAAVIGGKRVQFDFSGGAVLRPIDEPGGSS